MESNTHHTYRAAPWRWLAIIILTGVVVYSVIQNVNSISNSLSLKYLLALGVCIIGLIIAYLVGSSKVVINEGQLKTRNVLGITSKTLDLQNLSKAEQVVGIWPRWDNQLRLTDKNGVYIKLRLSTRLAGILGISLPNYQHSKEVISLLDSYTNKSI